MLTLETRRTHAAHHQAMNRGRNKRIFITELGAKTLLAVIKKIPARRTLVYLLGCRVTKKLIPNVTQNLIPNCRCTFEYIEPRRHCEQATLRDRLFFLHIQPLTRVSLHLERSEPHLSTSPPHRHSNITQFAQCLSLRTLTCRLTRTLEVSYMATKLNRNITDSFPLVLGQDPLIPPQLLQSEIPGVGHPPAIKQVQ